MTTDEARELLRLLRADIARVLPPRIPVRSLGEFLRRRFLSQSQRRDLLSTGK